MIRALKNSERWSMVLAIIFLLTILISAYQLYALPGNLMLPPGYGMVMSRTYITLAITFVFGLAAIYVAMKSKKEIVVFKEKASESDSTVDTESQASKTSISLEPISKSLKGSDYQQAFLQALAKPLEAGQGAYYEVKEVEGRKKVVLAKGYALSISEDATVSYDVGEGLVGQVVAESKTLYVDDIPEGYIKIVSGLGTSSPQHLLLVPVRNKDGVIGVIEFATFKPISEDERNFAEEAANLLAGRK